MQDEFAMIVFREICRTTKVRITLDMHETRMDKRIYCSAFVFSYLHLAIWTRLFIGMSNINWCHRRMDNAVITDRKWRWNLLWRSYAFV